MTCSTTNVATVGSNLRLSSNNESRANVFGWRLIAMIVAIAAVLGFAGPAASEERLALVVGNKSYVEIEPLSNPAADARLMADALTQEGFTVTVLIDANLITLNGAIAKFGRDLRSAGADATGLFFYAGHGVQSFGTNYLLPVDVLLTDAADLDLVAVPTESVLRQMASARNRQNIVILDACRNNPFVNVPDLRDNGLAEMKAPTGTFLSYSTSPGAVALDGSGVNSPFTKALAKYMPQPGVPIEQLFRQVRVDVLAKTGGLQTPWDTSSLTTEFSFRPAKTLNPEELAEQQLWESINATRDPVQIVLFIRSYKDSQYAAEARKLLIEVLSSASGNPPQTLPSHSSAASGPPEVESAEARLAREQEVLSAAQESGRIEDYRAYLEAFPNGIYAEAVRNEMAEQLAETPQDSQATPTANADAPATQDEAVEPKATVPPTANSAFMNLSFTTPLVSSDADLEGLSIAQLVRGSPKFPPIEGMPDEIWKSKTCATCHQWTKEALCTQAATYNADPERISRIAHPYGGLFKEVLSHWSAQGCQ